MASNITPKLNLSIAPRTVNNQPLSIFNPDTDFKDDDTVKYVDSAGDVMSGVLTVPSLVTNGGITLPTTYTAAPTASQIGGAVTYTWTAVNSVAYSNTNLRSFIVGQGSYLIIYRLALFNITASAVNLSFIQAAIATSAVQVDGDYQTANMAAQNILAGFNTALNNCFYYNNVSGSPITLYLNYLCTTASLNLRGYVQVVRIG